MQNFRANYTGFKPASNIIKCKTEKPYIIMQDYGLYLGKANSMQKICILNQQVTLLNAKLKNHIL